MKRDKLIKVLANRILSVKKDSPILIGINGVDGSGKTFITKELKNELKNCGREIITASIDDFHNCREIRYKIFKRRKFTRRLLSRFIQFIKVKRSIVKSIKFRRFEL